ncbi:MAG: hypothetical protein COV73_03170 [Candidatus Omnitrophica bacterium CG11_big_fil_rev_8_21_14_0_20_43_6]|nr:MAG: hypothetical protein COV73_03170 [Candidatus Omnitrophica bacterium CG11_big_fil_rev_8_21_14_0_20_43_6]
MAKKESPEKQAPKGKEKPDRSDAAGLGGDFSSKISGLSSKLFGVMKFILAVIILPLVYSSVVSLVNEFTQVGRSLQQIFYNGIISFLAIYLFIWEPAVIYNKGHKLLEIVFSFFKPMVNVAPFLLPIYTILFFIIYGLLSLVVESAWLIKYTVFLIGFSSILHLAFAAKNIRSKKGDFLKANYIFGFSFILILNLFLLALGFSLIFKGFSFVNFCNISFTIFKDIFSAAFKQLFLF